LTLYLNGEQVWSDTGLGTKLSTNSSDFAIGRNAEDEDDYFTGAMDEVRVYKTALTQDQLQKQVYQSIENINSKVAGSSVPKLIDDGSLNWEDLALYYNMDLIFDRTIIDISSRAKNGLLNNITTIQEQTAPIPYIADNSGNWIDESTWKHGNIWDIEDVPNKSWAIVKIEDNTLVETNLDHDLLGLIIDSGSELQIQDNKLLNNTSYLELNGTIDLLGESQLLQTSDSDLALTSSGKIKSRQQGQSNLYRYNYWGSPVGVQSSGENNTMFKLGMLKEQNGNLQFTSQLSPPTTTPATLSTTWLYTFKNGVNYTGWASLNENSDVEPGVGYVHKGTGVGSTDFEYIFEGKPNNGVIQIPVNDAGGLGSVASISKTQYLLGNPYASAIDAHQFIDDNALVTGGTLYFWEQWGGDSHTLDQYEGGYATLTKLGAVRAYQFVGTEGQNNGFQNGTFLPERYIPVAQGFMTEITNLGVVEFNNDQRVFATEVSGESQFFRSNSNNPSNNLNQEQIQTIRIEFTTQNSLNRELLIGFSELGTDDCDYGYDAKVSDIFPNDLIMQNADENYVIQFLASIVPEKEVDLFLQIETQGQYKIKASELINIDPDQGVYLHDAEMGVYHDLKNNEDYVFNASPGSYSERFKIVFQEGQTLSTGLDSIDDVAVFVTKDNLLYVKNLENDSNQVTLTNILGQKIIDLKNISSQALQSGFKLNINSNSVYIVTIETERGLKINKKIVVD